jgi:hypothetical protein
MATPARPRPSRRGDRGSAIADHLSAGGTLFPPEIVAPTFLWEDKTSGVDRWDVVVRDDSGSEVLRETVDAQRWRPSEERWAQIKQRSAGAMPT